VDELTRVQLAGALVDESGTVRGVVLAGGGWESGSCAAPADDAPEWPELLAALNARVDRLLDAKRAAGTRRSSCPLYVYYSGHGGRVPSPCTLDAGHGGECS
jgi:hypothetical protein